MKDPAAQPAAKASKPASKRKIETLDELEAITALLDADTPNLQRLFSAQSEQPREHPGAEPSPQHPSTTQRKRAVA